MLVPRSSFQLIYPGISPFRKLLENQAEAASWQPHGSRCDHMTRVLRWTVGGGAASGQTLWQVEHVPGSRGLAVMNGAVGASCGFWGFVG